MGEGGPRPAAGQPVARAAGPVRPPRRSSTRWSRGGRATCTGRAIPSAMLLGTGGWGLFVATPWVQVDLRRADRGVFIPWQAAERRATRRRPSATSSRALGKGVPPVERDRSGPLRPVRLRRARPGERHEGLLRRSPGPAAMPPKWALGYMQSHRTLEDDAQMLGIVDTFRAKQIPLDAVIYLGTGFCAARLEHAAAVVRLQSRGVQARPEGGARRHARAPREGRRAHGPVGPRPAADAARHDSRRSRARRSTRRTSRATGSSTSAS